MEPETSARCSASSTATSSCRVPAPLRRVRVRGLFINVRDERGRRRLRRRRGADAVVRADGPAGAERRHLHLRDEGRQGQGQEGRPHQGDAAGRLATKVSRIITLRARARADPAPPHSLHGDEGGEHRQRGDGSSGHEIGATTGGAAAPACPAAPTPPRTRRRSATSPWCELAGAAARLDASTAQQLDAAPTARRSPRRRRRACTAPAAAIFSSSAPTACPTPAVAASPDRAAARRRRAWP